jgi:hypothetical protein
MAKGGMFATCSAVGMDKLPIIVILYVQRSPYSFVSSRQEPIEGLDLSLHPTGGLDEYISRVRSW